MATNARSVWVKVEYRRPFSGVPSVTTLSFRRRPSATMFNFFRTTLSCTPDLVNQWVSPLLAIFTSPNLRNAVATYISLLYLPPSHIVHSVLLQKRPE